MRRLKILKIYLIFWLLVFFIIYSNHEILLGFFLSTVAFNSTVMSLLFIGLLIILKASFELIMLTGTFAVIRYRKDDSRNFYLAGIDKIFPENVAKMFAKRATHLNIYFTHSEVNEVILWLEAKFINQKSYIGFFVSMCLMVGLLGTFAGLLTALSDMSSIVLSLKGDVNIGEIMVRLKSPIEGMAVGFGSSLFGVAAAIILSVKGYVLEKNQAIFIEDVQDWINSLIIESPTTTEDGIQSGGTSMTQMMDVFTEKLSAFTDKMSRSNKATETVVKMLSESIEEESKTAKDNMIALDSISEGIRDLNINHYQSSSAIVNSIQDLSTSTINSSRNFKTMIDLQQKNNQLLIELLNKIEKL